MINAPFLLLITPEVAALDEDGLTALFEKIGNALRRSGVVAAHGGDELAFGVVEGASVWDDVCVVCEQ